MKERLKILTLGLTLFLSIGLGRSARAGTWSMNTLCGFDMNGPQMFAFTNGGIESVWSNYGTSWVHQPIATPGIYGVDSNAIACASDGRNQAIVIFRESATERLWAVDRLSGWQPSLLDLNYINSAAMTGTVVYDQGRNKFVFFTTFGSGEIMMMVWDDSAYPKVSTSIFSVPGGFSSTAGDSLTSYSVNIGQGASVGQVSLFLVNNGGQLMEYTGPLSGGGSFVWNNWGAPPYGLSNAAGFGPKAVAIYDSIVGHPGVYVLGEYSRWVTVPTADGKHVYTSYSPGGIGSGTYFSWMQLGQPDNLLHMTAGRARGCTSPGEPCVGSPVFAGLPFDGDQIEWWYNGTTDGTTTPAAGWRIIRNISARYHMPIAFLTPSWTNLGGVFFVGIQEPTGHEQPAFINLDTGAISWLGDP